MKDERASKALPSPKRKRGTGSSFSPHPSSLISSGGLRFASPTTALAKTEPSKRSRQKLKNDPKLIAAARELRDRWRERVNSGQDLPQAAAKYDLTRRL